MIPNFAKDTITNVIGSKLVFLQRWGYVTQPKVSHLIIRSLKVKNRANMN